MSDIFAQRNEHTEKTIGRLVQSMNNQLGVEQGVLIGEHTCVYSTGSCGRMEMGRGSDLDAYVVRVDGGEHTNGEKITNAVKTANDTAGLPPLDGEGKYLEMEKAADFLDLLGEPRDDESGVLTKRMLLLLESRVLVGGVAYQALLNEVIDAYWQNEDLHPDDYLPIVLVNDIVRYWRIVLLNHESRLRAKGKKFASDALVAPEDEEALLLAERRYRSYKLRLPRCLTCFSALTYLLALTPSEPAHVSKDDVRTMIGLPPIERLRRLPEMVERDLEQVDSLLSLYSTYLERTDEGKQHLVEQLIRDSATQTSVSREGRDFTKHMFDLVQDLGGGRTLHRHMLV